MPTANTLALPTQEDLPTFRMPIEPSNYPDRSHILTEEERKSVEYLLTLSSGQYREFERQVEQLKRVVQPLLDVLVLFQRWRPMSQVSRQHFIAHFLGQILQINVLYWGWSESTWKAVIDAVPTPPKDIVGELPERDI
jgi:hypothetical protein